MCRAKKDLRGESSAKEISDALPFLEYELHRLLINKLRVKGMNGIFGLRSTLAVGEKLITLIATGTGVFVSALPAAVLPKVRKDCKLLAFPKCAMKISITLKFSITLQYKTIKAFQIEIQSF